MTTQAEPFHSTLSTERGEPHTPDVPEITGEARGLIEIKIRDLAEIAFRNLPGYEQQRKNLSILAWQLFSRSEIDVSSKQDEASRFFTLSQLMDEEIELQKAELDKRYPEDVQIIEDQLA